MVSSYSYLKDIQSDLRSGKILLLDLVSEYLNNIEKSNHINALLEVYIEESINAAKNIQQKILNGTAGKLAGLVIVIKDNIVYKNHKVTAGSKILGSFESIYSATVVERLLAEDAIIIGRANCDEFAMGSSNENSAFGNVLNPLDITRVPGGSSGGSAAAVAANMCHAALGSDTGGSIRQPASFCNLVGLKPSYGRISRWGLIAYASSFDQIGPLTKSIEDAAFITEIIAGPDEHDGTAMQSIPENYSQLLNSEKKYTFAYLKECFESKGLHPEIKKHFDSLFEKLKANGHNVVEAQFPYLSYVVPAYYVLTTAEASSNLSRFDGMRYGYRSSKATDLESTYKKSRSEGFGKEVQRRIMLGTFVLSSGYYDAYYAKAQKVRRMIQNQLNSILKEADFIIMPTTPDVAFEIGKNSNDPVQMYLEDIFTVQANLCGNPAISLPLGKNSRNLPFGVQLMAGFGQESLLFQGAKVISKI